MRFGERIKLIKREITYLSHRFFDTTYDILFRQRFITKDVDVEIEEEPKTIKDEYERMKAYCVWYSGRNYEIRREISVEFWYKKGSELPPDKIGEHALNTAISRCGYTTEEVYFWASARGQKNVYYAVPSASLGKTASDLPEVEAKQIIFTYTKNAKPIKQGSFFY